MKKAAGISDSAVRARTDKKWGEWFEVLDAAGARKMDHKGIVAYLGKHHRIGPWWQQMVTVGYEQARGIREKHQKPGGYEISVSKTTAVPVGVLYKGWLDKSTRRRWLPKVPLVVRKATLNKSLRVIWKDHKTALSVNFYGKGRNKSQVVVQHTKLRSAGSAERMKKYWASALDRLKVIVER